VDLLVEAEAARLVRLAPKTLRNLRHRGGGPRFRKAAGRVVYDRRDVERWLAGRAYIRTHEPVS
jgi:DNA-binding transcriptional MerR regulator